MAIKRSHRLQLLLVASALLLLGCAPSVDRVYLLEGKPQPKPEDHPIRLYSATLPECPYEEIGLVTVHKKNKLVKMEKLAEALREEARKFGGDAVIGVNLGDEVVGDVWASGNEVSQSKVGRQAKVSGTVIRWLDPDCRE